MFGLSNKKLSQQISLQSHSHFCWFLSFFLQKERTLVVVDMSIQLSLAGFSILNLQMLNEIRINWFLSFFFVRRRKSTCCCWYWTLPPPPWRGLLSLIGHIFQHTTTQSYHMKKAKGMKRKNTKKHYFPWLSSFFKLQNYRRNSAVTLWPKETKRRQTDS